MCRVIVTTSSSNTADDDLVIPVLVPAAAAAMADYCSMAGGRQHWRARQGLGHTAILH
jgi:hypothetical protein